ncbi:DUF3168 domain-containing protein [Pseudovibrio exalbescens]|uniref:DUF3168 domain-containing protein n=1 Tax=Pseudovibrio exalbescens TaxID=197461 RepID=A0A1U7JEM1_9HYPH|nr:DUF3168 domain-containing protein [Pseudovibrio exalbescens]OKL43200.1 hypothetical protein A3843_15960 [Pseudovibrio exalbescens]
MSQSIFRDAVITALRTDTALLALMDNDEGRIVDGAPAFIHLPYLSLSQVQSQSLTGNPADGDRVRFTIEAYSRALTRSDVAALGARVTDVLTAGALTTGSGGQVLVLAVTQEISLQRDRRTWRARLAGRAVVE